jgi:nucleotide-binding universal stress UspA family protein
MNRMSFIVVVAERASGSNVAVHKAVMIARHFGAHIELFTCEDEHGIAYAAGAAAVTLSIQAACAPTVSAGICRHVRIVKPSLVIKSFTDAGVQPAPLPSITDLNLIRACSAPLLLTYGRSWSPSPKICALLAAESKLARGDAAELMAAAKHLAEGCHGELEVLREGQGEEALARHVAKQRIDVIVVAAHDRALTDTFAGAVGCDVLIVPPPAPSAGVLRGVASVVANSVHGQN